LGAAVFTAEYLPRTARPLGQDLIELLAGIPSVVYGLLGILLLRNWIYDLFERFDLLSGDTLLTAGVLLAVMILPTIVTLSDDALRAVPAAQRRAARALGLTHSEAIVHAALPQARRGLAAALLLALGRAFGETIAVFLVVGRQDNNLPDRLFSLRPLLESGQTLTSKLGGSEVNIAYGDPLHWGAIIGLGLILLVLTGTLTVMGTYFGRTRMRKFRDFAIATIAGLCALVSIGLLAGLVFVIAQRGAPALSWSFFTEQIRLVGAAGGIFWNLVGTVICYFPPL
jgi:phosphate transport system permease protein